MKIKECRYCGMPLDEEATDKICAYCRNDEGREMINLSDCEDVEEEASLEEY